MFEKQRNDFFASTCMQFFCKGRQPYSSMVNLSRADCKTTDNWPRFSAWRRIWENISLKSKRHQTWKTFPNLSLRELFGFFLQGPGYCASIPAQSLLKYLIPTVPLFPILTSRLVGSKSKALKEAETLSDILTQFGIEIQLHSTWQKQRRRL